MKPVAILALVITLSACASSGSMPEEFDGMAADEVGCVVQYGETDSVIGPLGPSSDPRDIEPNSYTVFHFGRTVSSLSVVATRERDEATMTLNISEISTDDDGTLIHEAAVQDTGNPRFEIHCWAGSG